MSGSPGPPSLDSQLLYMTTSSDPMSIPVLWFRAILESFNSEFPDQAYQDFKSSNTEPFNVKCRVEQGLGRRTVR